MTECYFCGGRVNTSQYNSFCAQELGPCIWLRFTKRKDGKGRNYVNGRPRFVEKRTNANHCWGRAQTYRLDCDICLVHIGPNGVVDTYVNSSPIFSYVDDKHIVQYIYPDEVVPAGIAFIDLAVKDENNQNCR